jgi:apolipoprotein D and lipocalin family protein
LGRATLGLLLLLVLAGCTGVPNGLRPVGDFQLQRYLGTWYEIARLEHRFERGLTAITATYTARQDGGIDVHNRGWDASRGVWKEAQGRAYFITSPDSASIKVSFFGPFYGGYHVFALDPDYAWALVTGPSREYLWILARQPVLPPALQADLLARARQAGFDTQNLIFPSPQAGQAVGTPTGVQRPLY